jgi:hypothetical protein
MTARKELINLAYNSRNPALSTLLASYTVQAARLDNALHRLKTATASASDVYFHSASTSVKYTFEGLSGIASEITVISTVIDELLFNIAILLKKEGVDLNW